MSKQPKKWNTPSYPPNIQRPVPTFGNFPLLEQHTNYDPNGAYVRGYNFLSSYQNPPHSYQPYHMRNPHHSNKSQPKTEHSKPTKKSENTSELNNNELKLKRDTELKFTEDITSNENTSEKHPNSFTFLEFENNIQVQPRLLTNKPPAIKKSSNNTGLKFNCKICNNNSESEKEAIEHSNLKNHNSKPLFKFTTPNDNKLKIIYNAFQCSKCSKIYFNKIKLITHLIKVHFSKKEIKIDNKNNILLYLCNKCNLNNKLNFYTLEKLYELHLKTHDDNIGINLELNHQSEININDGLYKLSSSDEILKILQTCICVIDDEINICTICNQVFQNKIELDLHDYCDNNFIIKYNNINKDVPMLKEEKIVYFCPNCKFNTLNKNNIENHIKFHKIRLSSECIPIVKRINVYYCSECKVNDFNYAIDQCEMKHHCATYHSVITLQLKPDICNDIKEAFKLVPSKNVLSKNVLSYTCKKCAFLSLNLLNVQLHIADIHKDVNDAEYPIGIQILDVYCCEMCMMNFGEFNTFVSSTDYKEHFELLHLNNDGNVSK